MNSNILNLVHGWCRQLQCRCAATLARVLLR